MQQEVLQQFSEADIRVYAMWIPVIHSDERAKWNAKLLPDRRMTHFWDDPQRIGAWFSQHVSQQVSFAWDAYFLYGADAAWDELPQPLDSTGYTLLETVQQLRAAMQIVLTETK